MKGEGERNCDISVQFEKLKQSQMNRIFFLLWPDGALKTFKPICKNK